MHIASLPRLTLSCLAALAMAGAQAQTAPPIKPGLWQVQTEHDMGGQKVPDMSEHLKNMPPEARKRMETLLKQQGVNVDMSGGALKICLTRQSLDEGAWQQPKDGCKTEFRSRSGSTWKWHSSCSRPPSETDGEATFTNPESYTVKAVTTMAMQGQTRTTRTTINAKWVGADCGGLKPIAPPSQKP